MAVTGNKALGAVIYTRVSTGEQAEHGTSLDSQRDACLQKAASQGLPIVAEYEDAGISGGLLLARPGMQAALADIRECRAGVLICANLSRFSRDAEHQRALKREIETAGGRVVFCDMDFDATPEGDLAFGIMGNFAAYEKAVIKSRTMRGKRRRAEEGQQPQRSRPPYGYHIVTNAEVAAGLCPPEMRGRYTIDDAKAPNARRIYADYSVGSTLSRIARTLNQERIPVPGGGERWMPNTVRVILANPAYKGQPLSGRQQCRTDESRLGQFHKLTGRPISTPDVRVSAPEEHRLTLSAPALVNPEDWGRVQKQLGRGRGTRSGTPRHVRMLSGQTRCPHCGVRAGSKYQKANGKRYAHLTCRQRLNARVGGGERPCVGDVYPVEKVEAATLTAMRRAWESLQSIAAALTIYRREADPMSEQAGEELRAVGEALDALKREEASVVRAQMAGVRSGASPDAYAELFADIAARRKDLAARRREIEGHARKETSKEMSVAARGLNPEGQPALSGRRGVS